MRHSLFVGLAALGANPLRTLLSTLGVIIGVGALVSILSMGDGVERVARDQLERTTDFQRIQVASQTRRRLDDVWVPVDDPVRFDTADAEAVGRMPGVATATLLVMGGTAVARRDGTTPPRGVRVVGLQPRGATLFPFDLTAGAWPTSGAGVVLTEPLAKALDAAVGDSVLLDDEAWQVAGILTDPAGDSTTLGAYVPVDAALRLGHAGGGLLPTLALRVGRIEDVPAVVDSLRAWASARFPGEPDRVLISTNENRAEQIGQAMLVFKLLMGAIAGISLVVGGIGIMNVLLSSVTERTREIGIRKAAGATRRDVLLQFLTEAVAVTGSGSALGLGLGLGTAHAVAWLMRARTEADVYPLLTLSTVLVAVGAAVAVGILFGLYPALRAARLSPIEAIRHE